MNQQQILEQLKTLATETINQNSINIDILPTIEKLKIINEEDHKVAEAIGQELPVIAKAVDAITQSMKQGGRLIYVGAGTSGRLGILDAVECPPTYGVDYNTVVGLIAGGKEAFIKAQEGIEDQESAGFADLKEITLTEKDIVCGIAASGRTPYVIGGLKYANSIGCTTIAIACNKNSVISNYADIKIEISPGPEVISGSTRMKAGTAQKLILNMLSTTAMINLGKVYKNLMVDVKTSNEKLQARAKKIIMEATEVDFTTASEYLELAHNHVKSAIVMIINNCSYEEAQKKLDKAHGVIRKIA
ncbi:N-acetylmuramic acid 6-phosphate etherase [Aquella oligotrophica]|uniref:N-acetylmuramic acid 6-phosphate etherase n=1 Tax=Aquella oligotrophica TaxID=2067065 RepID=A0A2I7N8A1_9NEIS|nr:N-acetylmuramic acid 6-phosphate etherase [Aquella oligotrophica]AUR52689.1 N-acetylmuramic acid 6-phosphate etherase [Aquella oligotrophica]